MTSREDILAALKEVETGVAPVLVRQGSASDHAKFVAREKELDARERELAVKEEELKARQQQQDLRNKHILDKANNSGVRDQCLNPRALPQDQLDNAKVLLQAARDFLGERKVCPANLTQLTAFLMEKATSIRIPGSLKKEVVLFVIEQMVTTHTDDLEYGCKFARDGASAAIEELYRVGCAPTPFKPPTFNERKYDQALNPEIDDLERQGREYLGDRKAGPNTMVELTSYLMERAKDKKIEGKDKKEIVINALKRIGQTAAGCAADLLYNSAFVNDSADGTIESLFKAAGKSTLYHLLDLNHNGPDRQLGEQIGKAGANTIKNCCSLM